MINPHRDHDPDDIFDVYGEEAMEYALEIAGYESKHIRKAFAVGSTDVPTLADLEQFPIEVLDAAAANCRRIATAVQRDLDADNRHRNKRSADWRLRAYIAERRYTWTLDLLTSAIRRREQDMAHGVTLEQRVERIRSESRLWAKIRKDEQAQRQQLKEYRATERSAIDKAIEEAQTRLDDLNKQLDKASFELQQKNTRAEKRKLMMQLNAELAAKQKAIEEAEERLREIEVDRHQEIQRKTAAAIRDAEIANRFAKQALIDANDDQDARQSLLFVEWIRTTIPKEQFIECWGQVQKMFPDDPAWMRPGIEITPEMAREIRAKHTAGLGGYKTLASEYKITRDAVQRIVKNKLHPDPDYTPPSLPRRRSTGDTGEAL